MLLDSLGSGRSGESNVEDGLAVLSDVTVGIMFDVFGWAASGTECSRYLGESETDTEPGDPL